ncbi:MAG: S1-C subfamily serine protease [Bradymonadia bacterium]
MLAYIRAKSPGETVTLTVLRGRQARRVKITLDSLERRARN